MPPTFQLSTRALIGKTSSCLSASRMQKGYLRKVKDISFISTMPAPRGTSQQAALLRAPRFGGHPASRSEAQPCVARSAKQGGGDGLLSSPRQYSFSTALDTCSANSSSCPQVFHRESDSSRDEVTGRAGACTRFPPLQSRSPPGGENKTRLGVDLATGFVPVTPWTIARGTKHWQSLPNVLF